MAEEFQQIYLSRKANPEPLGDRPLIILGAGKRPQPPGTSDELWKQLRREQDELVQDLTHLSRNSKFILAPTSGHAIHNEKSGDSSRAPLRKSSRPRPKACPLAAQKQIRAK